LGLNFSLAVAPLDKKAESALRVGDARIEKENPARSLIPRRVKLPLKEGSGNEE